MEPGIYLGDLEPPPIGTLVTARTKTLVTPRVGMLYDVYWCLDELCWELLLIDGSKLSVFPRLGDRVEWVSFGA